MKKFTKVDPTIEIPQNKSIQSLYLEVVIQAEILGLDRVVEIANLRKYAYENDLVSYSWVKLAFGSMLISLEKFDEPVSKTPARSILF